MDTVARKILDAVQEAAQEALKQAFPDIGDDLLEDCMEGIREILDSDDAEEQMIIYLVKAGWRTTSKE